MKADIGAWLLDPDNPSARYLTLRTLYNRTEQDADVAAARRAIVRSGPARDILDAQYPAGYWMKPDRGYSPRYRGTVWQLIFLADLGTPWTQAVGRACDHVLRKALRTEIGLFSAHQHSTGLYPCLNGDLVRALQHFGYRGHPTVRGVIESLARHVLENGLICPRNSTNPRDRHSWEPCLWGGVKVLRALAAIPREQRAPLVRRTIDHVVPLITAHDLTQDQRPELGEPRSSWLRFGFPLGRASDLLEALLALAEAGQGAGSCPAFERALDIVRRKRDVTGRWPLESVLPNTWADFGRRGEPNKWVTLRALLVLRALGRAGDA